MKLKSRKNSPTIGEFIATAYSICFPYDFAHYGGTDADHVPVIPGDDFPADASHRDESVLHPAAPPHPGLVSELGLHPES